MKRLVFILSSVVVCLGANAQSPCDTLPKVTLSVNDSTPCLGDTVTLSATGGVNYLWNKGVVNGKGFLPSKTDTFQVIVTDTIGCKDTLQVPIEVLPLPDIKANSSSLTTCFGDSVLLNATNGVSYTWINPQIPNNSFFVTSTLGANIFKVSGVGANGCTNTSQVIVVVKKIPATPTLSTDSISTCVEVDFAKSIEASVDTGKVVWYSDKLLANKHQEAGPLRVQKSSVGKQVYYAVTHYRGCFSSSVKAIAQVLPRPIIDAGSDLTLVAGERVGLNPTAPSGSSFTWSPKTNLVDANDANTEVLAANSVTYELLVVDELGCESKDEVSITVENTLVIANLMTPNGDGSNDVWKVYPEATLGLCEVRLFDGFGRTLLETDNYLNDWAGEFGGETLPAGNYYYQITGPDIDETGTITLMR